MRRTVLWAAGLAVCLLLWLAGVSAAAIALAWLLFLPVFSWALSALARRQVEVRLTLPASADRGTEIPLTVTVCSRSRIPTGPVVCHILVTNTLTGDALSLRLPVQLPPRGDAAARGTVHAVHCGYLRVSVERVRLLDWFGLLPVSCHAAAKAGVTVLPELFATRVHFTAPPVAPENSPDYAGDRPGWDYSETFQLRDYREGDSLRAVHWKLTGKLDRLILRDPDLPVVRSVLVFWDKTAGGPTPEAMNALAEVSASLCHALCQQGVEFHLAWNEQQQIVREQIDGPDAFYSALPRLIHLGDRGELSGGALLLRQSERLSYGRIFYFGAALPEEATALSGSGVLTAFLWGDGQTRLSCQVLRVRPGVYAKELQTMELDT